MEIILHDGKREVMLKGEDGQFQLCYPSEQKVRDSEEKKKVWIAEKHFSSLEGACAALLRIKVSNSEKGEKGMKTPEEKAKEFAAMFACFGQIIVDAIHCETLDMLKQRDRDTRRVCAEAISHIAVSGMCCNITKAAAKSACLEG